MLSQLLVRRASPVVPTTGSAHAVRWRGEGVSRIEGLSDAVFGFPVTLLVVALEVPRSAADRIENAKQFVPFAWSFFVLCNLWRAQFEFFRRYGLEDARTINLTGVLLVLVLFAVYPLKFLSIAIGAALISGPASIGRYMRLEDLPRVLGLYGLGFFGIAVVFSLLYSHVLSQHDRFGLTGLELCDTRGMRRRRRRRWRRAALLGATILSWCGALLLIGDHFRARDELFTIVWWGGCALIMAAAFAQAVGRRSQMHARHALVTEIVARSDSLS